MGNSYVVRRYKFTNLKLYKMVPLFGYGALLLALSTMKPIHCLTSNILMQSLTFRSNRTLDSIPNLGSTSR